MRMRHMMNVRISNEQDVRVRELRSRLDNFYATTREYAPFEEDVPKVSYWVPIVAAISETIVRKGSCHVLEFGAGRSSFSDFLGELRGKVDLHAQDVTATNEQFLRANSIESS